MSLGSAAPPAPVVFIVDDDPSVRNAIKALLASVGLDSEMFGSALEMIDRVRPLDVGCVIMDVRMPKMSGLEAQQVMAEHQIDLPLIFVTAHADVPLAVRVMKAGAVEVLEKPFDTQALIESVQRAIETHRILRESRLALGDLKRRFDALTERERAVMAGVVSGQLNKQIAGDLGSSEKTVKTHRSHVMRKMGAESVPDLVRMAERLKSAGDGRVSRPS
jgi:FixJ family two-component response regulator